MATGGGHDGHQGGDAQEGLYDAFFPLPEDDHFDDDDLLWWAEIVASPTPPAAAAPVLQGGVAAGPSGDDNNLLAGWPAVLAGGNSIDVVDSGPTPSYTGAAVVAGLPSVAQDVVVGANDTGCQVLREVVHSNGFEATKLIIHGGAGVFHHALTDVYRLDDGVPVELTNQSYIDFTGQDYVWVKQYLSEYAQQRAAAGYAVLHDSISAFHDALCTTMAVAGHVDDAGRPEGNAEAVGNGPSSIPSDTDEDEEEEEGEHQDVQPAVRGRSALAIQRERASNMQLSDIAPFFDIPIVSASEKLGVGVTLLKGVCRKYGVKRWPHRTIKKMDTAIEKLRSSDDGSEAVRHEIESLMKARAKILLLDGSQE
ncbi:hypothetical protein ACP4OV_003471 [Aristida adscensionis]